MTLDQASDLIRQTLMLALITALPVLIVGLVVGVVVSLFQAITQIQEQTLALVPKIAAMAAAAVFLTPWATLRLMEFAAAMFSGR